MNKVNPNSSTRHGSGLGVLARLSPILWSALAIPMMFPVGAHGDAKAILSADFEKLKIEKIGLPKLVGAESHKPVTPELSALLREVQKCLEDKGYSLVILPYEEKEVQAILGLDLVGKLQTEKEIVYSQERKHNRYSLAATLSLVTPAKKTLYKKSFTRWRDFDLKTRDARSVKERREQGYQDPGKIVIARGNGPPTVEVAVQLLAADLLEELPPAPASKRDRQFHYAGLADRARMRAAAQDFLKDPSSKATPLEDSDPVSASYKRAVEAFEQGKLDPALQELDKGIGILGRSEPFDPFSQSSQWLDSYLFKDLRAVVLARKGEKAKAQAELEGLASLYAKINTVCPPYAQYNLEILKKSAK